SAASKVSPMAQIPANRPLAQDIAPSAIPSSPSDRIALITAASAASLRPAGHGDCLDLDHDSRVGKSRGRDGGTRRKVSPENLGPDFGHPRGIAHVDEK